MPTFVGFGDKSVAGFRDENAEALERIKQMERAADALWNGVTDILTQPQVDKMEMLYREELKLLLGDNSV